MSIPPPRTRASTFTDHGSSERKALTQLSRASLVPRLERAGALLPLWRHGRAAMLAALAAGCSAGDAPSTL
ncbi:MAG TPA: hypothetical protein VJU61_12705, partial [Polyangiaceae bacterium]|nr:hypothetical protein [Polyangiaceae bacterium]